MSSRPPGQICSFGQVQIETFVDGEGPPFVILPSYGRDGGEDFDDLARHLAGDGWRVLRPQPRGIAGSKGPMSGLTMHDLAADVARSIATLSVGAAVVLGHAFGNVLARVLTTDHPHLVKAASLAAAEVSEVPQDVEQAPFQAGDLSKPQAERLQVLQKAFFAPGNDASVWLGGWYPATLEMEHQAVQATELKDAMGCGNVPLLQLIPEHDPFIPRASWDEMRRMYGERVTSRVIADASHSLFPEQPSTVADEVVAWARPFRT